MHTSALTNERIVKLAFAFREAKVVLSAVELGLFTVLGGRATRISNRSETGSASTSAGRGTFLMRWSRLGCSNATKMVSMPTRLKRLLSRSPEANLRRRELDHVNAHLYPVEPLIPALRTGSAHGAEAAAGNYPSFYSDPVTLEAFLKGMTGATLLPAKALATKSPGRTTGPSSISAARRAACPCQIAQVQAHITGGGFDLPPVKPLFDSYVQHHSLSHRLRFHPGDFFNDPMTTTDVLIMVTSCTTGTWRPRGCC